jgi:hypothetical protein
VTFPRSKRVECNFLAKQSKYKRKGGRKEERNGGRNGGRKE